MLGGWSSTIDPIQLADKGARLSGELPIKGMSRLAEMCRDDRGSVHIDLQFDRAPSDGVRIMQGTITADVDVTCQRCMGSMRCTLTSLPRLVLLRPGEREDLLDSGDARVVDQPLTLGSLVEDELLLEMPMAPMHPTEDCPAKQVIEEWRGHESQSEPEQAKPTNPFTVLQKLKHSNH